MYTKAKQSGFTANDNEIVDISCSQLPLITRDYHVVLHRASSVRGNYFFRTKNKMATAYNRFYLGT